MAYRKYTKELLEPLVSSSTSITEVIRKLGMVDKGGNYETIRRNIKKFDIDTSHMTGQGWMATNSERAKEHAKKLIEGNTKHTIETALVENISLKSKTLFRLFSQVQPNYSCSECGISEWNDKEIRLHIDHVNGNNLDNRPENLRWLCPNCHSQTNTYCGRNCVLKYGKEERKKYPRKKKEPSEKIYRPRKKEQPSKDKTCPQCKENFKGFSNSKFCSSKCSHLSYETVDINTIYSSWLKNDKNFSKTSRELGISDNAIRKRLRNAKLI